MRQQTEIVELNIVSALQVRRYARGELLPKEQREVIEQTILDDDRARRLVVDEAERELPASSLTEKASRLMSEAFFAATRAVVAYETLTQRDGMATMRDYAASRFVARWRLSEEIKQILAADNVAPVDVAKVNCPPIGDVDDEMALKITNNCDTQLLKALNMTYRAPIAPQTKAKIAGWISSLENDLAQIAWLKSALR